MIEEHDNLEARCRMLGHQVPFKYCRTVNNNIPCRKIFDCWFEIIPIKDFINRNFSKEVIQNILAPPTPKMTSILNLVEESKKYIKKDS